MSRFAPLRSAAPAVISLVSLMLVAGCATAPLGGVELSERSGRRALDPEDLAQRTAGAVAIVTTDIGRGMAFVVDPEGYLLTNRHVIEDADHIDSVTFPALEKPLTFTSVEIVYIDPRRDLALLKIDAGDSLAHLPVATSGGGKSAPDFVGTKDPVMLLSRRGAPDGSDHPMLSTDPIDPGLVAHLGQVDRLEVYNPTVGPGPYLAITQDVQQGQSGGPVLDRYGRAVGVVTWTWRDRRGGFAIPISEAARMLGERPKLDTRSAQQARALARTQQFLDALGAEQLDEARRITSPSHAREVRGRTMGLIMQRAGETSVIEQYLVSIERLLDEDAEGDPFEFLEPMALATGSEDFKNSLGVNGRVSSEAVITFFFELGQAYLAARHFGERERDEAIDVATRRLHSLDAARSFVLAELLRDVGGSELVIEDVEVLPSLYRPKAVVSVRRGKARLAVQLRMEWGDWYVGDVQVMGED